MHKIVLSFGFAAALVFGACLSASPLTASVDSSPVGATFCTPPPLALVTPAQSFQSPGWLSSGDCWYTYQQCLAQCPDPDPENRCWLACNCEYCVCAGIFCLDECNFQTS